MKPWFAAAVLAFLMCFTLTCYFFKIPDDLRRKGKEGRWGPPNAEFNWCEPDYLVADWLAEPVNTVSNMAIMVPPMIFLATHPASRDICVVATLQAAIGAGSVLFHATLRYSMQLCDELPMLWYSLSCAVIYLHRLHGVQLAGPALAFASVVSVGILATSQHSTAHEFWRGTMSCAFSACAVLVAWGSASLVARMQQEFVDKRRRVAVVAERMHTIGFVCFALAVVCWLVDNYFCTTLWHLPLGLPYPHLHTLWHILVGAAIHMLLILFQLDDQSKVDSAHISWRWLLPAVVVAA
mmetsp:Transcript_4997/g.18695  ORF Transcript_4997/g.18695 Transcript_4997/m.18695 type:complete len:295 (-) Transcript_4997:442-1326(-)|eukprot:CAMPEP_0203906402 /NCGR_PEP_ID=MMETSP0359-20131031/48025_1 /ASSEMBLY_ACC=CAM_ASM_000338 /TAXON_ID=268821 /ORGANISM="Scrippsiella Hangoei, Strain SHTV-5" /LENGTH=294 /DNA_ID=CAMNT_0050831033 /DNA_START=22 /DNA_END=906 /DNA_ORIENTATION=-